MRHPRRALPTMDRAPCRLEPTRVLRAPSLRTPRRRKPTRAWSCLRTSTTPCRRRCPLVRPAIFHSRQLICRLPFQWMSMPSSPGWHRQCCGRSSMFVRWYRRISPVSCRSLQCARRPCLRPDAIAQASRPSTSGPRTLPAFSRQPCAHAPSQRSRWPGPMGIWMPFLRRLAWRRTCSRPIRRRSCPRLISSTRRAPLSCWPSPSSPQACCRFRRRCFGPWQV